MTQETEGILPIRSASDLQSPILQSLYHKWVSGDLGAEKLDVFLLEMGEALPSSVVLQFEDKRFSSGKVAFAGVNIVRLTQTEIMGLSVDDLQIFDLVYSLARVSFEEKRAGRKPGIRSKLPGRDFNVVEMIALPQTDVSNVVQAMIICYDYER